MRAKIVTFSKADNQRVYDVASKLVSARSDVIDDVVNEEIVNIVENVDTNNILKVVVDFYPHNVKPSFVNDSLKTWHIDFRDDHYYMKECKRIVNESLKTWHIEFHDGHCYKEEYKWQRKKLK